MEQKGHCIICHEDNVILSDEHVIPEAIGGYYHIYNVCKECNSKLGDKVDIHLLNHWFIKASRHEKGLKGYSNTIPNPLTGDGVLPNGQKVRLEEDKEGNLMPHLLPSSPSVSEDGNSFRFEVDTKDEKLIPKIEAKILKKNKIDSTKMYISSSQTISEIEHPEVAMRINIDLKNYKIGLLKIAYEFTVDKIADYYIDPTAKLYASILKDGSLNQINEVCFEGDSMINSQIALLDEFVDNNNTNRHLLLLINNDNKLYCLVKIFDKFCQLIKMSDKAYGTDGLIVLAINDFKQHSCKFYTPEQLVSSAIENEYSTYCLDSQSIPIIEAEGDTPNVGFSCNKDNVNLLFDKSFKPVVTEEQLLLSLEKTNMIIPEDHQDNGFSVTYSIPQGLFYMLMPGRRLIRVNSITRHTIIRKI
ncbi:MAG: HNH endonuclease [Muribaculaceae bacterium]|nr:HNH endonuclease [Muribaculaceae bacterium]